MDKEFHHRENMTYKLNPEVGKILCPVVLSFSDVVEQQYENGTAVADAVFDHKYVITALRAVNNIIELKLAEQKMPIMNWNEEQGTSFF